MKHRKLLGFGMALSLAAGLLLSAACSVLIPPVEQPNPTLTALYQAASSTLTARPPESELDTAALVAAQVRATAASIQVAARQTERAVGRTEAELVTATAVSPVLAELEVYGLDPGAGRLGWIHDPLTLEAEGYRQTAFAIDHPEVSAGDFAVAADITWDTQNAANGCGFLFRSDGKRETPSQYVIFAAPFANGRVVFSALLEGELHNLHDYYPKEENPSFTWEKGTTNRLAIIARGTRIEIYTNYIKIAELQTTDPPKLSRPPSAILQGANPTIREEYEEIIQQIEAYHQAAVRNFAKNPAIFETGLLGMVVLNESGSSTCTFTNAWLWLIGD